MSFGLRTIREGISKGLPPTFLRNLSWQYLAAIGSGVLGGLYAVFISRTLGLVAFGTYSLCLSIAALIFNCADLRLQEVAIRFLMHPDDPNGVENASWSTIRTLFVVDLAVRAVALAIIIFTSQIVATYIVRNSAAGPLLAWSGAMLFISKAGNSPAVGILRSLNRFEWTARLTIADWAARLAATLVLAIWIKLTIALVLLIAIVVGGVFNLLTVACAVRCWSSSNPSAKISGQSHSTREFWTFVKSCYGISLSDNAVKELDSTLVGWFLNVEAVGIYRMAKYFVQIVWRVSDPIFLVIMPEFRRLLRSTQREALRIFLRRVTLALAIGALITYVFSSAAMPWVTALFLGPQFQDVALVYPLMLSFILIGMPLIWTHAFLAAAGRPDIQLRANLIGNSAVIVIMIILTPYLGVYGAAIGWSIGMSATFGLSGLFVWQFIKKSVS